MPYVVWYASLYSFAALRNAADIFGFGLRRFGMATCSISIGFYLLCVKFRPQHARLFL
jgi:hypothetical protein